MLRYHISNSGSLVDVMFHSAKVMSTTHVGTVEGIKMNKIGQSYLEIITKKKYIKVQNNSD